MASFGEVNKKSRFRFFIYIYIYIYRERERERVRERFESQVSTLQENLILKKYEDSENNIII